jgi:hypothetical protein
MFKGLSSLLFLYYTFFTLLLGLDGTQLQVGLALVENGSTECRPTLGRLFRAILGPLTTEIGWNLKWMD